MWGASVYLAYYGEEERLQVDEDAVRTTCSIREPDPSSVAKAIQDAVAAFYAKHPSKTKLVEKKGSGTISMFFKTSPREAMEAYKDRPLRRKKDEQ